MLLVSHCPLRDIKGCQLYFCHLPDAIIQNDLHLSYTVKKLNAIFT